MTMRLYIATLATTALAAATALVMAGYTLENPAVVLGLAAVAAYAEQVRIRLDSTTEESISLVPTLFAALLFGPLAAMVVAAASMLPDLVRPRDGVPAPQLRWLTYTSSRAITAAVVALAADAASREISTSLLAIAVATTVGAVVAQALDAFFAALTAQLRRVSTFLDVIRSLIPLSVASVPLYAPIVAFLVYAYRDLSPLTVPLFFVPALAAQRLFVLYNDQRRLAEELLSANEVLERVNVSFATALVATLEARDRYTAGHSASVAVYARDIAIRLGLSTQEQNLAHLSGLVHDIGKIGLPAGLLEKPGALTLEERRQMEQHPAIGERILRKVDTYSEIASIVRHHHERIDGHGYPDGLIADEIPLLSRIIAVADAYDAMTSDRPYRDAMPSRVARLRLAQAVDSQFDISVVAAFEAVLASSPEEYRVGRQADLVAEGRSRLGDLRAAQVQKAS